MGYPFAMESGYTFGGYFAAVGTVPIQTFHGGAICQRNENLDIIVCDTLLVEPDYAPRRLYPAVQGLLVADCGTVIAGGTREFRVESFFNPPDPEYPPQLFVVAYDEDLINRRTYQFPIDTGGFAFMNGAEMRNDTSVLFYGWFWDETKEEVRGFIREINDDFCVKPPR